MRFSVAALTLALAASSATAAPSRTSSNSLSNLLTSVLHEFGLTTTVVQNILSTDASKHGSLNDFFTSNKWRKFIKKITKRVKHNAPQSKKFIDWKTYKANGVNLGSWLEIENNYTPDVVTGGFPDEWTWCETLGKATCGPILEKHYTEFISKADIDKLAKYGINTLRIPTTYAAFYEVPGSQLYSGNQKAALRNIAEYAISKYNMHIVLGLHSLPGGTNGLQIGESYGHLNWWYNSTNFDYSLKVVDGVLDFIQASPNSGAYTFAPINEPCDNMDNFGTPTTVSAPAGVNYYNSYLRAVYAAMQKRKMKNALMISDAFMGASYWAPFWPSGSNIVMDSHFYYFAADGVYSTYTGQIACGQAASAVTDFPVFVGEFSTASFYNNTLAGRASIYQTQVYAWTKYLSGGAMWNVRYLSDDKISAGFGASAIADAGEGKTSDYWSFMNLIDGGAVNVGGVLTEVLDGC